MEMLAPWRRNFDAARDGYAAFNAMAGYAERTWTPTITFATPGNLSVSYSSRLGNFTRIARRVKADFFVTTSAFTHTTASGALQLTGLPLTCRSGFTAFTGPCSAWGWTKANYTQVNCQISASAVLIVFPVTGSGQALTSLTAADMPTGGTVALRGFIEYDV